MTAPSVIVSTASAAPARTRHGVVRRLLKDPAAIVALSFLGLVLAAAVFAPLVAPHDPDAQNLRAALQGPSWAHLLGTDGKGRDVLSRIIFAGRIALMAPLLAVGVGVLLGIPTGLLAGITRGPLDAVLGRIADTLLSIPPIVMAIAIIAILGPGLTNAMLAIGLVYAPGLFRIVRSATLNVSGELYIDSARSIGCSSPRLLWSHVLPNVAGPLLVQISLLMGFSLLAEASLSFLGLGVQIPTASWGSMLRTAYDEKFNAPYAVIPPGVVLSLTILAFNVLGDSLRDAITARRRT